MNKSNILTNYKAQNLSIRQIRYRHLHEIAMEKVDESLIHFSIQPSYITYKYVGYYSIFKRSSDTQNMHLLLYEHSADTL